MLRHLIVALALLAGAALPSAAPAQTTVSVPGVPATGPAKYDRSFVTEIGPAKAKTVLVLVPAFAGGAGDFTLVGQDIVNRVPDLQVWAVDRRSQALEDTAMFVKGMRGEATIKQVFDYYLGWIT